LTHGFRLWLIGFIPFGSEAEKSIIVENAWYGNTAHILVARVQETEGRREKREEQGWEGGRERRGWGHNIPFKHTP
jgi:hypothetical protein